MEKFEKLIKLLGIQFKNPELLKQAFVHRSYLNESKKTLSSNERLEFLGDSILSFLVSEYLYKTYEDLPEGELTNLRSSIVKTEALAEIALKLSLGDYLYLSKGEEEGGGRKNPSILADTFEALLGAIFLDIGLTPVKKIIKEQLLPILPKIIAEKTYKDAKSNFQEMVQETVKLSPVYKVIQETGPDHAKRFTVGVFVEEKLWGKGEGRSKQEAEQKAAMSGLEKWSRK
ncbi:ribonuclease III [Candidatus Microgenomates bacterium]|nr:ribonuclease III [Candidatus Microgenomates bacterium]